jgi:hypothetical protein
MCLPIVGCVSACLYDLHECIRVDHSDLGAIVGRVMIMARLPQTTRQQRNRDATASEGDMHTLETDVLAFETVAEREV